MKKTRQLVASLVAIVICFAMLLGTTYAWFTDSIVNTNNIIKSGNVDVELLHTNSVKEDEEVTSSTKLFVNTAGDPILWEPGASTTETFVVKNVGSLAFKYEFRVKAVARTFTESGKSLSEILTLKVTGEDVDNTALFGDGYAVEGKYLLANDNHTYTVTISWDKDAENNNDYNVKEGLQILLGIELVATQYTSELDGTGDQYDIDAQFPNVSTYVELDSSAPAQEVVLETKGDNPVSATVPVDILEALPDTVTSIAIAHTEPIYESDKVLFEAIKLVDQFGNVIDLEELGVDAQVTVTLPAQDVFAEGAMVDVYHDGEKVNAGVIVGANGVITYSTAHFSEVTVQSSFAPGSVFVGENPVKLKPEVFEADPNLIAINYVQEGQTCYVIADKTKTKVLAANDTPEYVSENGGYDVTKISDNQLYSIISGLQGNDHSTVYLLPGTYNAGTTINVYSSMDIIGLGDKEDIKVVKSESSGSNRHLFNVNGQKEDYIEVTIKNMTLEAYNMNKNKNGKMEDNAAVQSIRKSKTKCYDLIIKKNEKPTSGLENAAFYVNGNNAVDGVKYPAYLYAENCTVSANSNGYVVSANGTYKFYYSNLKMNNGEKDYTNNSGSIKNVIMDANDWDWEN